MHFHKFKSIRFISSDDEGIIVKNRFVCCGARTWTLVIGWIETILWATSLVLWTASIIWMGIKGEPSKSSLFTDVQNESSTVNPPNTKTLSVLIGAFKIAIPNLGLIAGIGLIFGVQKRNSRIIKTWMLLQTILLILIMSWITLKFFGDEYYGDLIEIILVTSVNIFCIWVVNVHRKEIVEEEARYQDLGYGPKLFFNRPHGNYCLTEEVQMIAPL